MLVDVYKVGNSSISVASHEDVFSISEVLKNGESFFRLLFCDDTFVYYDSSLFYLEVF